MNWQDLQKRQTDLSLMQNIPDLAMYAEAWNFLAADFEAIDVPLNAEYCRKQWRHYRDLAGDEYVRMLELPLISVPAME